MPAEARLLLTAIGANAAFSLVSAATLLLAGDWISQQLGTPPESLLSVAAILGLFALQLGSIVLFHRIKVWEIIAIITADLLWVVGSAVGLARYHSQLSTEGIVMVVVVALAVLAFAELQGLGLKRWWQAKRGVQPA